MTNDEEAARWIAAIMRVAGVRELKIPDKLITGAPDCSIFRYRDEAADVTVFRLVDPSEVVDAEVVDELLSLPGGDR